MPYIVIGNMAINPTRCNFIVIHDFFDVADATSLLFKNVTQVHNGCQVLCFNYPGQANTVWPRLSMAEKGRGAIEPALNNDWIADRLHELLQYVEAIGDLSLSNPFHLVGIGNGASIAGAFAQRWGEHSSYYNSFRSIVSVNGFLHPDPQLTAILHSSADLFENTTHSRPDIPVSFWSRFLFSEEYLTRVNPNLALNILTAVSNPITNDGRRKIARGAMQHRDIRGGLAPDLLERKVVATATASTVRDLLTLYPVKVPVVLLQSTENMLVNASNVDPFLAGRNTKHLWSHQLNVPSQATLNQAADVSAQWVGRLSSGPEDYQKYSILGKAGLRMILDTLGNSRGAFVMWTRTGHAVQQESKSTLLDLLDVLAYPSEDYVGYVGDKEPPVREQSTEERMRRAIDASTTTPIPVIDNSEVENVTSKMQIMFRLNPPPKRVIETGRTLRGTEEEGKEKLKKQL
jgi:pimeloyl-ACP methyl ester carboxylesterase